MSLVIPHEFKNVVPLCSAEKGRFNLNAAHLQSADNRITCTVTDGRALLRITRELSAEDYAPHGLDCDSIQSAPILVPADALKHAPKPNGVHSLKVNVANDLVTLSTPHASHTDTANDPASFPTVDSIIPDPDAGDCRAVFVGDAVRLRDMLDALIRSAGVDRRDNPAITLYVPYNIDAGSPGSKLLIRPTGRRAWNYTSADALLMGMRKDAITD